MTPSMSTLLYQRLRPLCQRQPSPLFVDVGANLGWMAALAAHWGCRVIAFEPQIHLRAFWRSTSALNGWGSRVVWIAAAVGERSGAEMRLQRPAGDWGQVHAAASAAEAASHEGFLPHAAGADTVAVVRVTDVVSAAAAVKIDVEGSEAAAMRSCGSLLLDPALQLAAIEFQGSSDTEFSEGVFAQLLGRGLSAYIFQEEYFRSIRSSSPRMQGFPIMPLTQFQGLSRSKPFDDVFFTREALPPSWLWEMSLSDSAHRLALQQLQHASPHEQSLAASFLSRWSRNLGDMEYFAAMGSTVCQLHLGMGQLLRASNDCYILWSVTRNVKHAVMAITAQRASGRWEQAETTLAELRSQLLSAPHAPAAAPLHLLARAGVPGSILARLPLHANAPAASAALPEAAAGSRGIAIGLVHCSNAAVAAVAHALAQKSALLVCIGSGCPPWCGDSFGGRFEGQCSCEPSLLAVPAEFGGGVGMLLDACKEDGGGCEFERVAADHAAASALGLPTVVFSDSYHGAHPLLSRAFAVTHPELHAPDSPLAFHRSLRMTALDFIRFTRASVPVHHIAGWGSSAPAYRSSPHELHRMLAHARAHYAAAASSSPIVFVLNAAAATPSIAADIAAASGQSAHIVLGSLLPESARLWVEAVLKLGALSARLFWCDLVPHGPEDALPYHDPRSDAACIARLQAAAVAADIVFDAQPAGGSLVEVLQHCVWGAIPAIASTQSALPTHVFERVMHEAALMVGMDAPLRLSGALGAVDLVLRLQKSPQLLVARRRISARAVCALQGSAPEIPICGKLWLRNADELAAALQRVASLSDADASSQQLIVL